VNARPSQLSWRVLAAIGVLALVLRVLCVAEFERSHPQAQRPGIDERSYDSWAREIAGGDWLGSEIFFQEPAYPYALGVLYAASGADVAVQRSVARYSQAVLGALSCVWTAMLAARLFGTRAGWLAGAALALHRPSLWFPALLLKENLFVLLLVAFTSLLVATREHRSGGRLASWLALGALGGLGALLRGNMLLLLPVFALWPIVRARSRRGVLAGVCFVAGAFAMLLPVALRNQHVGGRFVLSTSGAGTNFYGGNNLSNPYGVATEFDWVRGIPEHEASDWRHEASRRAGRELDASGTSEFWLGETLRSMRENPGAHLAILWRKLRLTLGSYEVPDNHFLEWDARFVGLLRVPWPGFALLGTLSIAGALAFLFARRAADAEPIDAGAAREVALVAGAYLATVVLTVTSERVRLPLVPLLLPFAGHLLADLKDRARGVIGALIASGAASALVLVPVLPQAARDQDFDERDFNLAVGLLSEGDLQRVAPLVDGLVERRGESPRVQVLAAELEYRAARALLDAAPRSGRMPDAPAERIESALRRLEGASRRGSAQERFRADVLAGAIRQYLGQWSHAESSFRSALAFDPSDRDLRRRLAVVIAEQAVQQSKPETRAARMDEALALLEALLAEQADPELAQLAASMRERR
jgi:4-amino-4-deoxy-L-arabinose transferase-like glycosyltransferase